MDPGSLQQLQEGSHEDITKILSEYNEKNAKVFTFPDFQVSERKHLVSTLLKILKQPADEACHVTCLETLRILSRDKKHLEDVFSREVLDSLSRLAGLIIQEEEIIEEGFQEEKAKVIVEAQKTLCNLIFNSPVVQRICSTNGCIEGVMLRLKLYSSPSLPHDVKYFDMRMLFLLTALCADIRPRLRSEQHGVTYLREALDLVLKGNEERGGRQPPCRGRLSRRGRTVPGTAAAEGGKPPDLGSSTGGAGPVPRLDDREAVLAAEILKVLFNLTVSVDKSNVDEEDEMLFQRLVGILHDLLLCDVDDAEKKDELCGQVVHVLSNMPRSTYEELLSPGHGDESEELEFEGFNIEAVNALLDYLEKRLDTVSLKNQSQSLTPILHCLTECARGNSTIRKYLRAKILPPLKDVMNRPEEGDELRNKLVRLMTSPNTDVKNLVADLLFVLCKEKVGRLIKYTGYGNAAGLLANRGLMLGGRGQQGSYSSDSEDSDTEEYARYRDKINPVLGCYEEPCPNPLDSMTQEQKEYEAMQLVKMMDKLTRGGVLKPMRVGEDGRPHPVEHILELQEGLHDRDLTESESD